MILGDSLQSARSRRREGLARTVQCIYFDPPTAIKSLHFQWSTTSRDVKTATATTSAANRQ